MDSPSTQAEEAGRGATTARRAAAEVIASLSAQLSPALRRFFKNRRIPKEDIEDLVQEVFVRLASRPNVESLERIEAYLFATASNLLHDRYRRMTTRLADEHESYEEARHGVAQDTNNPERVLLATQIVAKLIEALFELPVRTRTIFTLYHLEDLSHREIANHIGTSISTIERHMTRANAHLLTRMEGQWP